MRIGAAVCGAAMALTAVAGAEVVVLTPVHDATMIQENDALANGRGLGLFAGNIGIGPGYARRALLQFDVSSIPANAIITRVDMTLTLTRTNVASGNQPVSLHRVTRGWNEGPSHQGNVNGQGSFAQIGDVTWSHTYFSDQFWTTPGGDFGPVSASRLVGTQLGAYTWASTPGLIADVQSWISAPSQNFGWAMLGNEAIATTAKRFASREAGGSQRPQVLIEYVIPAPASLALAGLGLLAGARRRR